MKSQPTRAAWIEITLYIDSSNIQYSRSPLGLRGLKLHKDVDAGVAVGSQPTRAAWIEIVKVTSIRGFTLCRSPLGLRGLKCLVALGFNTQSIASQPTRAAWIEISIAIFTLGGVLVSQPTRAAWIEIKLAGTAPGPAGRRSPLGLRGLKYSRHKFIFKNDFVAAHSGCVD